MGIGFGGGAYRDIEMPAELRIDAEPSSFGNVGPDRLRRPANLCDEIGRRGRRLAACGFMDSRREILSALPDFEIAMGWHGRTIRSRAGFAVIGIVRVWTK